MGQCASVTEHFPIMHKALSFISSTTQSLLNCISYNSQFERNKSYISYTPLITHPKEIFLEEYNSIGRNYFEYITQIAQNQAFLQEISSHQAGFLHVMRVLPPRSPAQQPQVWQWCLGLQGGKQEGAENEPQKDKGTQTHLKKDLRVESASKTHLLQRF